MIGAGEELCSIPELLKEKNLLVSFLEKYQKIRLPVYLYGSGRGVLYYIKLCEKYSIPVQAIIESDETKWGRSFEGTRILGVEEAQGRNEDFYVLISAPAHADEIMDRLKLTISTGNIFAFDASVDITQNRNIAEYEEYIEENKDIIEQINSDMSDDASKIVLKNVLQNWITYDCRCLKDTNERTQYFPDLIKERLEEDEVFVDCGAFDGDSVKEFIGEQTKGFKKIYAFEPDPANLDRIKRTPEWEAYQNKIALFQKGVYDFCGSVFFRSGDGEVNEAAHITGEEKADGRIDVVALDDIIKERVTYIKMDIEGSERKALTGAKRLLVQYKPKLAICVYHRYDDLIGIYEFISGLGLGYKFYLRHYWNCSGTDVVLFAV